MGLLDSGGIDVDMRVNHLMPLSSTLRPMALKFRLCNSAEAKSAWSKPQVTQPAEYSEGQVGDLWLFTVVSVHAGVEHAFVTTLDAR